ncbi:MAG: DUF1232 domain-containing protein [Clostridiaceae bacterium]|jgi:uncharacterized membrane protein YkvA (DUF1232 family)|nr:DUF1232 domain-containing protein [Clostridiaceae bacterium]
MNRLFNKLMLVIKYLRNKDIPFYKKLIIVVSLIYIIFPADIMPDYVIGIGILDDLVALVFILLTMKSELDENNNKGYLNVEKSKKMFDGKKRKGK